jgi:hypothetical protein
MDSSHAHDLRDGFLPPSASRFDRLHRLSTADALFANPCDVAVVRPDERDVALEEGALALERARRSGVFRGKMEWDATFDTEGRGRDGGRQSERWVVERSVSG